MSNDAVLKQFEELIRETFEGARPGEGTYYLDKQGGLLQTLAGIDAARASRRLGERPSIAAHARHLAFHMRVTAEWIAGDHGKRDWLGSFAPQAVNDAEWVALQRDLASAREELLRAHRALDPERFAAEGAGYGELAHLAYHLGAIRQLAHLV